MQDINDPTLGKKRPRGEIPASKNTAEVTHCLSPHTLRLLKLVEEGTAEHAQLAAVQLSEITAGSSPLILWDVLGRLQGFLTSPQWKTRQNASVAMEGVAHRLPVIDQQDFLQDVAAAYRDQDPHTWLTLKELSENLGTILENGRTLLSSSESNYDEQEEDELQQMDATFNDRSDFVQRRVQLQRQILARRLGLSTILSHVSGKELDTVFSTDDLTSSSDHAPNKRRKNTSKNLSVGATKSIRSLLISEIQQQQAKKHPQSRQSHRLVSHQNAQRLLATELVFRMFDSSWYVRHGSLMGLLALLRAWNVHGASSFGIWPQDILARCLCVLALDRFADYSETATSSESGGIVAPVREMAGQVVSVLYRSAPQSLQELSLDTLISLTKRARQLDDWETRHAALLALRYIAALQANLKSKKTIIEWYHVSSKRILEVATMSLGDKNDDVRGKAAQLLLPLLLDEERLAESIQFQLFPTIVNYLWESLTTMNLISSSVKDLVSLLSALVTTNLSTFLQAIHHEQTQNVCSLFLSRLKVLTDCPYLSVKTSVISLLGEVVQRLEGYLSDPSLQLNSEVRSEIADSFCDVTHTLYRLYFERGAALQDAGNRDYDLFLKACQNTWLYIAKATRIVLKEFNVQRSDLVRSMILRYFDLPPRDFLTPTDAAILMEVSFGRRHCFRIVHADALAILLSESEDLQKISSHQVLEMCIRVCLDSPFVSHCESACLLLTSLYRTWKNAVSTSIFDDCKTALLGIVQERPRCVTLDKRHLQDAGVGVSKVLRHSFECGMNILSEPTGNVHVAVSNISALWGEVIGIHLVESTQTYVSLDSMRLSVTAAGALISGGLDTLPTKLTPIVRALMTSIQNELDEDCRSRSCEHMVGLLILLTGVVPSERKEALYRTGMKIIQNLCKAIKANTTPACTAASQTISKLVSETNRPLQSIEVLVGSIIPLLASDVCTDKQMDSLLVFEAICSDIGRNEEATSYVISTFLGPMASLHCFASDPEVQRRSGKCIEALVAIRQMLALPTVLPHIALMCKSEEESVRERACDLLVAVINGPATPLCPFVRSLLPLAMQLMIDPSSACARAAARMFSRLVQLAPLVEDSVVLRLFPESWDDKAERVMDHLIKGKALPPCDIHPVVETALSASGVTLRQYQLDGIAWLRFLQTVRLNGALTDSMGLGKTLQALIGVALAHADAKPGNLSKSIVICPSSVLGHWMKEVSRFFPDTNVFRPFCLQGVTSKKQIPDRSNLIITSYAVLRAEAEYLSSTKWCYCVLDEGHLLKNPKTATAKAARRLQSQFKLILTGTPVQNKVHEVWATFDFLMPNFLGSSSEFTKCFARPISKGQAHDASATDIALGMEKLKLLHQQVLPFILRREKEQVLQELPPKIVTTIPCEMTSCQLQLYQEFCSSSQGKNSLRVFYQALQEPSTESAIPSLGSDVLKALLYLRLICTHPSLVDSKGFVADDVRELSSSGKLVALKEILRETGMRCQDLAAADNDTSLMYVNADECEDLEDDDMEGLLNPGFDDGPSVFSPSIHATVERSKCLIFAQFTFSLDVVEELLLQHFPGTQYLRLDGKVPIDKRGEIVDAFNNIQAIQILLLTTRIGGLGLNLTGADTVIFLEHDWNPHADLQAMDRAHRIGQTKTVNVYKLVTQDSIEEKIMKLHEQKLAMSNAIVNTENSTLFSMGTDQLLDIFQFRSDESDTKHKDMDKTLDILVESYEEEYMSLSLVDFIDSFKRDGEANDN